MAEWKIGPGRIISRNGLPVAYFGGIALSPVDCSALFERIVSLLNSDDLRSNEASDHARTTIHHGGSESRDEIQRGHDYKNL
jgi:hypothetical protein